MCYDRISSKDNLVEKSGAVRQAVLVHELQVYGLKKKKKNTSDQCANEKLNWQGFKSHTNYVLLWLRISAMSHESNSTAELTPM